MAGEACCESIPLLSGWRTLLEKGHWQETIDCRDEMLLHDLCSLLRTTLSSRGFDDSTLATVEVAVMELCRNVVMHATTCRGEIEIGIDYELGRFTLAVTSAGEPFSLEAALQKHCQSANQMRVHGFTNLLPRGTLHVTTEPQHNIVRFGCVMKRTGVQGDETILTVRLTSRVVQVHRQSYEYGQWVALAEQGGTGKLLKGLVQAWKESGPVRIGVVWMPPEWTLNEIEISCLRSFGDFVERLSADSRFRIIELTIATPPEQWRSQIVEGVENCLKEALQRTRALSSA
jgi:anti-sigma regulatory factor (Ser/Thr protein kinase)